MREHKQCKQITEFTDFLQKGATTISTCSCTAVQKKPDTPEMELMERKLTPENASNHNRMSQQ